MPSQTVWTPARGVFLRRAAITLGATVLLFLALGLGMSAWLDLSPLWVAPTALLLGLGFVLEDWVRWRAHRADRWQVAGRHLLHEGPDGTTTIPLSDVARARRGFGGRVVLHLVSGKRIVMRDLRNPARTVAAINAARKG